MKIVIVGTGTIGTKVTVEVALAYLGAIFNPITGQILKLHKTNC
ncbi:MAG TPA: hypothetical protein VNZ64_11705 [Candidatus Acidoferrum sp.]|nr:hypothetical protein [Candidatus Acidoferrum sp.]